MKKVSYNNIALFVFAAIVIGASIYSRFYVKSSQTTSETGSPADLANSPGLMVTTSQVNDSARIAAADYTRDTDKDGLMDWEEVLWGSNENDPDTDKDGMKDGEEVAKRRSPTVKGPGNVAQNNGNGTASTTSLSQTDKFGRELFTRYMELRQAGLSTDSDSRERLIAAMLQSGTLSETQKIYKISDIKLNPVNTSQSLRNYGNTVAATIKNNSVKSRNEGIIIKDYLDNNNEAALLELNPVLNSYKKTLSGLLALSVPSQMKDLHLGLVNIFSELVYIVESYKKIETDPVLTLQAVGMYQGTASKFSDTLSSIRDYFVSQNITYNKGEAGELFNTPE